VRDLGLSRFTLFQLVAGHADGGFVTSLSGTLRNPQGLRTSIRFDDSDPNIEFKGTSGDEGRAHLEISRKSGVDVYWGLEIILRSAAGFSIRPGTYVLLTNRDDVFREPNLYSSAFVSFFSEDLDCEADTAGGLELTESVLDERGSPVRLRATFSLSCEPSDLRSTPPRRPRFEHSKGRFDTTRSARSENEALRY
jgi:hypothetical protein